MTASSMAVGRLLFQSCARFVSTVVVKNDSATSSLMLQQSRGRGGDGSSQWCRMVMSGSNVGGHQYAPKNSNSDNSDGSKVVGDGDGVRAKHRHNITSSGSSSSFSSGTRIKTVNNTKGCGISVDVPHGNKVDRALRMLRRKLIDEGIRETWMAQRVFVKPSHERKRVLEEAVRRNKSREFKEKMRWILRRKARGY